MYLMMTRYDEANESDSIRSDRRKKLATTVLVSSLVGTGAGTAANILSAYKCDKLSKHDSGRLSDELVKDYKRNHKGRVVKLVSNDYDGYVQGGVPVTDDMPEYMKRILGNPKNDIVLTTGKQTPLAHELGHAHFQHKNKFTKGINKTAAVIGHYRGTVTGQVLAPILSAMNAAHSGYNVEKNKFHKNKKVVTNVLHKAKTVALPALIHAPTLLAEAGASIHGYNSLKRVGASQEELSRAKKLMGTAFGAYAGIAAIDIIATILGYYGGKKLAKNEAMKLLRSKYPNMSDKELELMYKDIKKYGDSKQKVMSITYDPVTKSFE